MSTNQNPQPVTDPLFIARLTAETSKLMAETIKLGEESRKLHREYRWYPFVVAAALMTAGGALVKLFGV